MSEYALAINKYWYHQLEISLSEYEGNLTFIDTHLSTPKVFELDLSNYKNPLKRPSDSQLGLGYELYKNSNQLLLRWQPASHTLKDNNINSMSESELKVFNTVLSVNDQGNTSLYSLNVFEFTNLIPYEYIVGGVSSHLSIGVDQQYDEQLEQRGVFSVSGGYGLTALPVHNLSLYGLGVANADWRYSTNYISGGFDLGAILYIYNHGKLHFSENIKWNMLGVNEPIFNSSITFSVFFSKSFTFDLSLRDIRRTEQSESHMNLMLRRYF